jgi:hypothetical protein
MGDLGKTPPSSSGSASVPSPVVLPDGTQPIPLGSGVITAKLGEGGMAAVIVAILAAVAIPLYSGYIRDSRVKTADNIAASVASA